MDLDFSKLISWKNVDKAVVGNRYYYFDEIIPEDLNSVNNNPVGILDSINDISEMNPFVIDTDSFSFLYPYEEEEKQYLTYEELKEKWLKNPTELYRYKTDIDDVIGMISSFNDTCHIFNIGLYTFSEHSEDEEDIFIIKNLTDINGNPLTK